MPPPSMPAVAEINSDEPLLSILKRTLLRDPRATSMRPLARRANEAASPRRDDYPPGGTDLEPGG